MDNRRARGKIGSRALLKAEVNEILRILGTPLRDIVREKVLHLLPVKTLLRFQAVARDWNHQISVPIFRHLQSREHRTASGVFQQRLPDFPAYLPFDHLAGGIPDPFLSFLPIAPPFAIVASSNGLLCCAGRNGLYYICNPSTAEWAAVPIFPDKGRRPVAEALVFEPSVCNIEDDFWLVRACEISDDCKGVFTFDVFSSATGEWRISSPVCAVEGLIDGSGVSAGGVAYWRTTMLTAVSYDPVSDSSNVILWPKGVDPSPDWQLGEIDGRLCCTCVTDSAVEVYALASPERWDLMGSFKIIEGKEESSTMTVLSSKPRSLRFQSRDPEVLLWMSDKVVGLDLASGKLREVCLPTEEPWTSPYADYVPHISTFARVRKN